jgi:hypothetical protein
MESIIQFFFTLFSFIGFLEVLKLHPDLECIIFHDVELLSENDRNIYSCGSQPRQLSVLIDKYDYMLTDSNLESTVFSIQPGMFMKANGYSNSITGSAAEERDFYTRLNIAKLKVEKPPYQVSRYRMMHHKLPKLEIKNRSTVNWNKRDGLNAVKYGIIKFELFTGFSYFLLDVGS